MKYIGKLKGFFLIGIFCICMIPTNAQTPSDQLDTPPNTFDVGGPGTAGNPISANGAGATPSAAPPSSPQVPFDKGMSLVLIVSGIGYAAKKLKWKDAQLPSVV